ncbi:MAG: S8 family serine peptidase, partial [Planctomycetaceae bacterium]|nr:S8 family serine peptidase [Planctomycetaceae bacterium]
MLAAELDATVAASVDTGTGLPETESVFWEDRTFEIQRGQWVVQFDRQSQVDHQHVGGVDGTAPAQSDAAASAQAWLLRKPPKQLISVAGTIERRLYEFDDLLVRSAMLNAFANSPGVISVEPNYRLSVDVVPDDPSFSQLWGLDNADDHDIDAPEAWELTTGTGDIVVGVIDTGVDYNHEDLAQNIWVNPVECPGGMGTCTEDGIDDDGNGYIDDFYGWDFINNDNDPMDDNSHGTHVAGTIAAVGNNATGVVGVNWNAKIMALKFLGSSGSGYLSDAVEAIEYAAMMKRDYGINIRLTNNSWGGGGYSQTMYDAISANRSADMLFVAAAGNDSYNNDTARSYPASYNLDNIISVASTTSSDGLSSFSNYGSSSVDLGAPGSSIYSTIPGNRYGTKSGTSMASPHVAGVAALAWGIDPAASYGQVRSAVLSGVDPVPALTGKTVTGGRLSALGTLQRMGLFATLVSPQPNVIVDTAPTTFTIDFSDPINVASVNASDLIVNSIAADGFTIVDPNTVDFTFNTSPVTVEGVQTIRLPANSITQASGGDGVSELSVKFFYDPTPLRVSAVTPTDGSVLPLTDLNIQLDFTESLIAGSIGVDDLVLSDGRVDRFTVVDSDTVIYYLTGITNESELSIDLVGGTIADTDGFPNQPFSASFPLDIDSIAYPGVWTAPPPLGSRVRTTSIPGLWHDGNDEDRYVVNLEAGQLISATLQPSAGSVGSAPAPRLRILDPGGTPIADVSAAAGQSVVINSIGATTLGDYTVVVDTVAGTGGAYDLKMGLSVVWESESLTATNNDTLGSAEDVDTGWNLTTADISQLAVAGSFATASDADWYAITLDAGVPTTFSLASPGLTQSGGGPLALSLHAADGSQLASGLVTDDNAVIDGFAPLTTALFYVNVSGGNADYVLSATKGGTLDRDWINVDQNGSLATAQPLALPPRVVGHLGADFQTGPGVGGTAIETSTISLDSSPEGDMVRDVVYTTDGSRYLIAHRDSENVLVYDSATGNLLAEIPVAGNPVDVEVTPDGSYALSANTTGNTVTVIDLLTLAKVADIPTSSPWPYRVHVTADSTRAVVATAGDNYVVLSLTSFAETAQIEASGLGSLSQTTGSGYGGRTVFHYTDFVLTPQGNKLVGPGEGVAGATVDVFDLTTGTMSASIAVPDESPAVVVTADGSTAYAVSRRSVFETTISQIDLSNNSLVREFKGPGLTTDHVLLAPNEQELIGGRYSSLQFISLADGSAVSVGAGDTSSFAITYDGNYILARDVIDLNSRSRVDSLPFFSSMDLVVTSPTELRGFQISRSTSDNYKLIDIDGSASSVIETRTGGGAVEGDTPVAMEITADGLTAVTANYGSKNLSVIDLSGQTVTRWIDVGISVDSLAITPDGRYAIASSASTSDSVVLVDLVTGNVDATITGIHYFPRDVAISDDGTKAYAIGTGLTDTPDSLYIIDVSGAASSIAATLPIGDARSGIDEYTRLQLSPDGTLLAIPVTGSGDLVLIDTATGTEVSRISTGQALPTEVVFSPDGSYAYVRHQSGGGISLVRIDGTNTHLQKVTTDIPSPIAMTIDASGDYLYVATSQYFRNNEVHVVDARSFDVVHTVSLESEARPTRMHIDGNVLYLVATENFTPQVFAANANDTLFRIYAAGVRSKLVDSATLVGRTKLVHYSPVLQSVVTASQDQDLLELLDFGNTSYGDEDYYSFLPQVGDSLSIETTLPGAAEGLIDNELDLAIEVFDPQGRLIASSDDGQLQFTAQAIGAHTVHVFAQHFSQGEYTLAIDGATVTPGPSLLGFTPVDAQRDVAPDALLTMMFDEAVAIGSGQIVIKRVADDSTFATVDVTGGEVSVSGSTVIVTPASAWELGTKYYVLIDAGTFTGLTGQTFAGIADKTLWDFEVGYGFDFGDAPYPYPVAQSDGGARHSLFGPQMGPLRDSEPDGTQSPAADADDTTSDDDEDGVVFAALHVGQIDASFEVNVRNVETTAFIDAWIDFNADGFFGGSDEHVAISIPVVEGNNTIRFGIPGSVASGQAIARVRLSSAGGLGVTGNAPDGEVEDYAVQIAPPRSATSSFYPQENLSPKFSGGKSVAPVDLDSDGDVDLIFTDGSDNNVSWLENDGDAGFIERTLYSQWNIKYVQPSDFDGDGDMDVVFLTPINDGIGWFQNQGNETFIKYIIDDQLTTPQDFKIVDYDQDGDMDLVAVDNFDDLLLLYLNNGNQTFVKQTLATNVNASLVEVADLDHDGDIDFVVDDDGLSWYEQTSTGLTQHVITSGFHYAIEIVDIDSDGYLDIASVGSFDVNWYKNNHVGTFAKRTLFTVNSVRAIAFADLDGDGDMDGIARANNSFGDVSWLENDGAENFQIRSLSDSAGGPVDIRTVDVDGDSDLDIVFSTDFDGVGMIRNINGVLLSVDAMSPAPGSAMVTPSVDLSIRFDQTIQLGTGSLTIYLESDDSIVESIPVTSPNVITTGDTLIVNPSNDFGIGTRYYVRLDSDAVANLLGDPYEGVADYDWTFQTVGVGLDYGDAPDALPGQAAGDYNTRADDNGPSHVLSAELFLGRLADPDDGTLQNEWASADDGDGFLDDENSIVSPLHDLVLTEGAMPTISIVATNLTAAPATLTGWIDYDADGLFEASESAQIIIDPGTDRGIVALSLPAVPTGSVGESFARFRLGNDVAATSPVGPSGAGEVEDYRVTIRRTGFATPASATKLTSGISGTPILGASDRFGASIAALGDVDGDGVDDLAISAPNDDDLAADAGAVFISLMNADGSIKSYQRILPNFAGLPFNANDRFGFAIASAGDLNHDGVPDLYVVSQNTGNNGPSISRVMLNADGTVKNHIYNLVGPEITASQLTSFASIGDLDGDGNNDFAFGESIVRINGILSGAVHVMFTADDGSAREFRLIASETGGGPVLVNSELFGNSITSLGDLDGDGIIDLAIGAPGNRSVTTNSGAVHILFMKRDGTVKSSYQINGTHAGEPVINSLSQFGFAVTAIGDLNGDGVTEILVGADSHSTDSVSQTGQAFVLYLADDG